MKKNIFLSILLLLINSLQVLAQTDSLQSATLFKLSADSLLELKTREQHNLQVSIASKVSENIQEAPGIVQVITKEEIEAYGYTQLYDVLNRVTSMFIFDNYAYNKAGVTMRGNTQTGSRHVLFMLNGRPLRETNLTGVDTPFFLGFPVGTIERIEVIRGPGSVLYGSNAFMGSINIVTKVTSGSTSLKASVGNQDYMDFEGTWVKNDRDIDLKAGLTVNTREGNRFEGVDELDSLLSTRKEETAIGAFMMLVKGPINVEAMIAHSTQNYIGVEPKVEFPGIPSAGQAGFESRRLNNTRAMLNLGYHKELEGNLALNIDATVNFLDFSFDHVLSMTASHAVDYILEPVIYYSGIRNLNLVAGANVMLLTGDNSTALPFYKKWWYAGYTQADYRLFNIVKLIGGLQINRTSGNETTILPRAGLVLLPLPNLTFKALYSQAFRAPMPFELGVQSAPVLVGNPDLLSERVEGVDFQLIYTKGKSNISFSAFHSEQTDLIIGVPPSTPGGSPIFGNGTKLVLRGLEFEANLKVGTSFGLNAALSYQENELINADPFTGEEVRSLNHSLAPNFMPKIGVYYNYGKRFGLGVFYNGLLSMHEATSIFDPNPDLKNPFIESVNLVSLNFFVDILKLLNKRTQESLRLELYVDNLLDEEVWYPEYIRRQLNSIPGYQRRLSRISLNYRF